MLLVVASGLVVMASGCAPAVRSREAVHPCVHVIQQSPTVWSTPGQGVGKVAGAVYDPAGKPLRGTKIVLQDSQPASFRGVVADSLGRFVLDSVPSGRRSFRLELLGYRALIVEVVIPGQIDTLCAMMQERRIPISETAIGSAASTLDPQVAEARFPKGVHTAANTSFHAAAARARGLAAADGSKQFCRIEAADMPAPCCARLRHVVNNRDVS